MTVDLVKSVTTNLLMLIGAAICFGLAAVGVNGRVNLIALGLFLWVASGLL